ncbi:hypothetical protein ACFE04_012444 [Oxalis oulophora]
MSVDPTTAADMSFLDGDASSPSGDDTTLDGGGGGGGGRGGGGGGGGVKRNNSVTPRSKRSRKATGDAIVDAMLEIAAASKLRATAIMKHEDKYSISKCIKVLDETQGAEQHIYLFALDLFENPSAREIFMSLKTDKRLPWLQHRASVCAAPQGRHVPGGLNDLDLELDEMEIAAAAAGYYYYISKTKQPCQSLSPKGPGFMAEALNGNDDGFREMFRMDKHVFHKLCDTLRRRAMLRDTRDIVLAACVLHNYIRSEERNDWLFDSVDDGAAVIDEWDDIDNETLPDVGLTATIEEQIASSFRESIAAEMWSDFINKWDQW